MCFHARGDTGEREREIKQSLVDGVGVGEHEVGTDSLVGVGVEEVVGRGRHGDEAQGAVHGLALVADLAEVDAAIDADEVDRRHGHAVGELAEVLPVDSDLSEQGSGEGVLDVSLEVEEEGSGLRPQASGSHCSSGCAAGAARGGARCCAGLYLVVLVVHQDEQLEGLAGPHGAGPDLVAVVPVAVGLAVHLDQELAGVRPHGHVEGDVVVLVVGAVHQVHTEPGEHRTRGARVMSRGRVGKSLKVPPCRVVSHRASWDFPPSLERGRRKAAHAQSAQRRHTYL